VIDRGIFALGAFALLMTGAQTAAVTPSFLTPELYSKPGSNPAQTLGPTIVDLNRDGKADLLFFDPNAQALLAELGNGDATFRAPISTATPGGFTASGVAPLVTGDFNGDGQQDVALLNGNGQIQIMFGDGAGSFRTGPVSSTITGPTPEEYQLRLSAGDFNGDGKTDFYAVESFFAAPPFRSPGGMTIVIAYLLINNGDGTFSRNQSDVSFSLETFADQTSIADVNNDGISDFIVAGNFGGSTLAVYLGNGDGTFRSVSQPIPNTLTVSSFATADFNKDGKLDLVVSGPASTSVLLGRGDGSFFLVGTTPVPLVQFGEMIADINGDGFPDLLILAISGGVQVALGSPGFTFRQEPVQFALEGNPAGVTDVNLDGKADLITEMGANFFVMFGQAKGSLQAPYYSAVAPAGGPQFLSLVSGDFNGDGKQDLVVGQPSPGTQGAAGLYLVPGNGDGTLAAPVALPFYGAVTFLFAADFNKDGKPDLAAVIAPPATPAQPVLQILLNDGNGAFQESSGIPITPFPFEIAGGPMGVADFNGDGVPDLYVYNLLGGNWDLTVLLGNGDGTFREVDNPIQAAIDFGEQVVGADVNGDGKSDLIFFLPDEFPNQILVFLSNGDGTFTPGGSYYPSICPCQGALSAAMSAGDFNGDGVPDLVILQNYESGSSSVSSIRVLLGTGNGGFGPPVSVPLGFPEGPALGLADMNDDGKLDVVLGNELLIGNGDGTFQPPVFLGGDPKAPSLTITDLNGDGKPDVAVSISNGSAVVSILNTTSSTGCPADVSAQIGLVAGGYQFNHATQRFVQSVTLTNKGQQPIGGPVFLVLDGLSSNVTLPESGGATQCALPAGSPWIQVTAGTLPAGQSAAVSLSFSDPEGQAIHYSTRVLHGTGQP
jgi:hypothetical protein